MTHTASPAVSESAALSADMTTLRAALDAAAAGDDGLTLNSVSPALVRVLAALEQRLAPAGQPLREAVIAPLVRRMKAPADSGPISGEAIAQRAMRLCGCKGQYDCDCVSVLNLARIELWTEHNAAERQAQCASLPACPPACSSRGTSSCVGRCGG